MKIAVELVLNEARKRGKHILVELTGVRDILDGAREIFARLPIQLPPLWRYAQRPSDCERSPETTAGRATARCNS